MYKYYEMFMDDRIKFPSMKSLSYLTVLHTCSGWTYESSVVWADHFQPHQLSPAMIHYVVKVVITLDHIIVKMVGWLDRKKKVLKSKGMNAVTWFSRPPPNLLLVCLRLSSETVAITLHYTRKIKEEPWTIDILLRMSMAGHSLVFSISCCLPLKYKDKKTNGQDPLLYHYFYQTWKSCFPFLL